MKIWELLGGLTVIVVLVFWIRWLLKPNASATWPENDWARASLLYAIPISLTLLGTTGVGTFAEHHGLPDALLLVLGIPMLFAVFIVGPAFLLTLFGVPMPPFLVPKWIRTQDREHRRLKRVARKRRWQIPKSRNLKYRPCFGTSSPSALWLWSWWSAFGVCLQMEEADDATRRG